MMKLSVLFDGRRPNRIQIAIWLAISVCSLLLALRAYDQFPVGTAQDDAHYVFLARSIVSGEGYGWSNTIGPDLPGGYPLLLAPFVAVFPDNLDILRLSSLFFTLLCGAFLFWGWPLLSRRSYWWIVAALALFLLSPIIVVFSTLVMSDLVFLCFLLAAILATELVLRAYSPPWWGWLLTAMLWIVLVSIRTIGILFVMVALTYALSVQVRRGRISRNLALSIPVVTIVVLLLLLLVGRNTVLPEQYYGGRNAGMISGLYVLLTSADPDGLVPEEYVLDDDALSGRQQLDTRRLFEDFLIQRMRRHLISDLRSVLLPIGGGERQAAFSERLGIGDINSAIGAGVLLLLLLGGIRWVIVDHITLFNVVVPVYLLLINLWRWNQLRFFFPVLPQLYLMLLFALEVVLLAISWLLRKRNVSLPVLVPAGVSAFVVIITAIWLAKSFNLRDTQPQFYGGFGMSQDWLSDNVSPATVVSAEDTFLANIYGGYRAVRQRSRVYDEIEEFEAYWDEANVDYILIAPGNYWVRSEDEVAYSADTEAFLELLHEMEARGLLKVVHEDEARLVIVFARVRDE